MRTKKYEQKMSYQEKHTLSNFYWKSNDWLIFSLIYNN